MKTAIKNKIDNIPLLRVGDKVQTIHGGPILTIETIYQQSAAIPQRAWWAKCSLFDVYGKKTFSYPLRTLRKL